MGVLSLLCGGWVGWVWGRGRVASKTQVDVIMAWNKQAAFSVRRNRDLVPE